MSDELDGAAAADIGRQIGQGSRKKSIFFSGPATKAFTPPPSA